MQKDAEAIRDYFASEVKFDKVYFLAEGVESETIAGGLGAQLRMAPTFGNLERFLDVRFRRRYLDAGDNLWFFFVGHGRRFNRRDYLMPIDANSGNVE